MRPERTKVRLVKPGGEYNRIYAMAWRNGFKVHKGDLAFPTVVAERDGVIVGFLSTQNREDAVWAGPMVVEAEHKKLLWLRLAEGYEYALHRCGVKHYLIGVPEAMTDYIDQVERMGFKRLGLSGGHVVLKRSL